MEQNDDRSRNRRFATLIDSLQSMAIPSSTSLLPAPLGNNHRRIVAVIYPPPTPLNQTRCYRGMRSTDACVIATAELLLHRHPRCPAVPYGIKQLLRNFQLRLWPLLTEEITADCA